MAKENAMKSNEPDYELAAGILAGIIASQREDISKVQGELSASWKRVEKEAGVHKAAAKAVFSLVNKSESYVDDYLRTFVGLARAMKLAVRVDLVTLMQTGADPTRTQGEDLPSLDKEEGEE